MPGSDHELSRLNGAESRAPRGRHRVLANAAWLYADQVLRAVIALVAFSAVTRHLGPEMFGVLSYAVAFPALFLPLATLGLDYVVVQELVRRPQDQRQILSTAMALLIAAAMGTLLLTFGATALLGASATRPLIWVTMWSLLGQPSQLVDFYFQSRVASRNTVVARIVSSVVVNGFRIGLVWQGASVDLFAWAFAIEAVVTSAGLLIAYRVAGSIPIRPLAHFCRQEAAGLLRTALPLLLGGVAMALYLRCDQLVLSHLAGPGALGRYAAAARLGEVAQFITYAMINSYFPVLIAAHGAGAAQFAVARACFFARITWLAIFVAIATTVAAPLVTRGLLGPRFEGTASVLIILAWSNVFAAQIGVRGKWFLVEGWQWYSFWFFALGGVLHIGGVFWLAPMFGPAGVATSYGLAQVVMVLIAPALFRKTRLAAHVAWRSFSPIELWR